jgi:hypothetical protein
MPPRIIALLDRLRQDVAAALTPDAIERESRRAGHSWRDRVLGPATTIYLFLLQILHGNTACQHVVHFGGWAFTDSAYCQARKRLPLAVYHALLEATAGAVRSATSTGSRWLGHRVWVVDGSSFSMPDRPELQRHFGQPGGQREGCGFPVAKWLALFDLTTGMLLRSAAAPLRTHEMSGVTAVSAELEPGDIVLGDRGFCSYAHLATLRRRELHAVFRVHQKQIVDFTPGRPNATAGSKIGSGLPRSRWIATLGKTDQVVAWTKPKTGPSWMTAAEFATLPDELEVRELRYRVEAKGYRTSEITLATTLLDRASYPASELADLYYRRWQVELNFRHMKTSMKMDVLRCETVDGVLKELAMFGLAYNLVRSAMAESAWTRGVEPDRIGLLDTVRWLLDPAGAGDVSMLVVNPERRGRVEPRVVKRRPKQYMRMREPRADLRKKLPKKGF